MVNPLGKRAYRFGDFEIDVVQECVLKDGVEQQLRAKTFRVLLTLVEHRGRIVTKQELNEKVWKDTAVADDGLVQCIVELRKLLRDDSRNPRFIKTAPKVGYRFIGPVEEAQEAQNPVTSSELKRPPQGWPQIPVVAVLLGSLLVLVLFCSFLVFHYRSAPNSDGSKVRQTRSEANDLYLKGRYLWTRRTPQSLLKSVEYFEQVIGQEPGNALAYAGMADSYYILASNGYPGVREPASKARAAARKALELDPGLAEPHAVLASLMSKYEWNWSGAEAEYKRAIVLEPDSPTAHLWYGTHLLRVLRYEQALLELKTAHRLDPLSLISSTAIAVTYSKMREYQKSLAEFGAVRELDPDFLNARLGLGLAFAAKGRYGEATELLRKTFAQTGEQMALTHLAFAYAISGERNEARKVRKRLENQSTGKPLSAYDLAGLHAALGEKDRAFESLAKAFDDRIALAGLQIDDRFAELRTDNRYKAIVRKIGFPEVEQSAANVGGLTFSH
jgi:DNA-binding winged helix-turn-helix (wHTH) protein/Tfp pilus assembly protein PilF